MAARRGTTIAAIPASNTFYRDEQSFQIDSREQTLMGKSIETTSTRDEVNNS